MFRRAYICVLSFFLVSLAPCGGADDPDGGVCATYRGHHYTNQFPGEYRYDVRPNLTLPNGMKVDTSGIEVDLDDLLVRQTDEVEACLRDVFPGGSIGAGLRQTLDCDADAFPMPIARQCLIVKVADDAVVSCPNPIGEPDQQVLPALAPAELCLAKGLIPTDECPCRWRSGIQDNKVIVVPPSFYLYKDPLIRLVTGCNDVWTAPLARCATPTVPPLPAP